MASDNGDRPADLRPPALAGGFSLAAIRGVILTSGTEEARSNRFSLWAARKGDLVSGHGSLKNEICLILPAWTETSQAQDLNFHLEQLPFSTRVIPDFAAILIETYDHSLLDYGKGDELSCQL
ncbi:hypothetical protein CGZ75_23880 [Paenibacillus herberti]|uniref:Uncharacterized protein n=1 Tax=Paenibacillus herberti TaxID=1619309 RepID=A0A229NTI8_9BACL|nr:hypothetical protein CGZ75_23880 [Paenibacillus herberti]